jgi:hypothetical protein
MLVLLLYIHSLSPILNKNRLLLHVNLSLCYLFEPTIMLVLPVKNPPLLHWRVLGIGRRAWTTRSRGSSRSFSCIRTRHKGKNALFHGLQATLKSRGPSLYQEIISAYHHKNQCCTLNMI